MVQKAQNSWNLRTRASKLRSQMLSHIYSDSLQQFLKMVGHGRALRDRPAATDRAAVETVGEGADVSEGTRAEGTGCRTDLEASAKERDIEDEEVVETAACARCL
jgi:hypothetical protein